MHGNTLTEYHADSLERLSLKYEQPIMPNSMHGISATDDAVPPNETLQKGAPSIPVELCRSITEQITRNSDLCSLARSSRTLQLEAERILYRCISIGDFKALIKAIKSIISHPRRHKLVQILDVDHDTFILLGYPAQFLQSSIVRLVARLLRITMHLRALRIRTLPGWILNRANHPLLTCFDLRPPCRRPADPLTEYDALHVSEYLKRHSFIMKLGIDSLSIPLPSIDGSTLHPAQGPHLPLLHTLNFSGGEIPSWLTDRQLKRFRLRSYTYPVTMMKTHLHLLAMSSTLIVLDLSRFCVEWAETSEYSEVKNINIVSGLPLLRYLGLPTPPIREMQKPWEDNLVRLIGDHLRMLVVFRLGVFPVYYSPKDIIPRLPAIRESFKWILTSAQLEPYGILLHTRRNGPQRPEDDKVFQHVLLDIGVQTMVDDVEPVCVPNKHGGWM